VSVTESNPFGVLSLLIEELLRAFVTLDYHVAVDSAEDDQYK
jgi:hypothetical protein